MCDYVFFVFFIVMLNLFLKDGLLTSELSQWIKVLADSPTEPALSERWKVIPIALLCTPHVPWHTDMYTNTCMHICTHTCTHTLNKHK